jgi:hypothetical protein
LQALVTESQKNVSGTVRVKLYKGNILTAGRKSPVSLYQPQIATMEDDPTKAYNQDDATGFIRLNALRLKVGARVANAGTEAAGLRHGYCNREEAVSARGRCSGSDGGYISSRILRFLNSKSSSLIKPATRSF